MVTGRMTNRMRERVATGIGRIAIGPPEEEATPESPQTQAAAERLLGEQAQRALDRYLKDRDQLTTTPADEPAIRAILVELVQEYQRREANRDEGLLLADPEGAIERLVDNTLGLGPLQPLMRDPAIEEIAVNAPRRVWIFKDGAWHYRQDVYFRDDAAVLALIKRVVGSLNARIDEASPRVELPLPDGSRLSASIPPVATNGCTLTIRKFALKNHSMAALVDNGTVPYDAARFLEAALEAGINILVSGGTGVGKTTLLNALGMALARLNQRLITIENVAELQLGKLLQNAVPLQGRQGNVEGVGEITIRDLLVTALRMHPDRLIVGEVRGAEALDLLLALNSGHEGSMSTIHANTADQALSKLATLARMAGEELPRDVLVEMVATTIGLVVQLGRNPRTKQRRVTHIYEVVGIEGGRLLGQDLWTLQHGRLARATIRPKALEAIAAAGIDYDLPPDEREGRRSA